MIAEAPMVPIPMRIAARRRETADTFTLALEAPGGFRFQPGQFNMLWAFGVGESAISVSGDPAEPSLLVHTIRRVGTVTGALERLRKGDTVGVRGPFGVGWPMEAARGKDVLVIAGGLGLAPLRPAIRAILHERDAFGRVSVLYGARTPEDVLYPKELERWGRTLRVLETVDRAAPGWTGRVGVAPALVEEAAFDPARTVAMVCGPEIMMRFTVRALERCGVPDEAIWLSLERNMTCALGLCGHCQFGAAFVCKDGPVMRWDRLRAIFNVREL